MKERVYLIVISDLNQNSTKMKILSLFLIFTFSMLQVYPQSPYGNYKQTNSTKIPEYKAPENATNLEAIKREMQLRKEKNEALEKERVEKTKNLITQIKNIYLSIEKYPTTIIDGWHKVTVTNNYDLCEERKVYVANNKITKYYIPENNNYREVIFSGNISNAKGIIKLFFENVTTEYMDIYFIEYCYNPGQTTTVPY